MRKSDGVINKSLKSGAKFIIRNSVKLLAAFPWPRRVLNMVYIKLTPYQRIIIHDECARLFRNSKIRGSSGSWHIVFANKIIQMPLSAARFWLDWDLAVSIVGHDLEIKEEYEILINSTERPELFIDIGANYGTHSLLFLVHHI
jgi:hypothetical protein